MHTYYFNFTLRDVLISAKESGYTNFVIDCPQENVPIILQHAQEVGLMADEHSYIFVSPDLFTLDLERYRYGGVNMTGEYIYDLILFHTSNIKKQKHCQSFSLDFQRTGIIQRIQSGWVA